MLFAVSHTDKNNLDEINAARAALKSGALVAFDVPDTEGFVLHTLCDARAEKFFLADENGTTELSRRVYARDRHLEEETGAVLIESSVSDFLAAAKADLLSGAYTYNLYAADAGGSLSKLLASASLHDVTDSAYLRTDEPWFDRKVMDELAVGGRRYLISSSAVDARLGAVAVVYRRALEDGGTGVNESAAMTAVALEGEFTLEYLLSASRASGAEQTAAAAGNGGEKPVSYGFAFDADDVFALYFGAGGDFIDAGSGTAVEYETFAEKLERVLAFYGEASVTDETAAFENGDALFTLMKLSDLQSRGDADALGILPLPKAAGSDAYRSYIDLDGTPMTAIPAGVPSAGKVEYLVERRAFLSYGYIEPLVRQQIDGGDADDGAVLRLIFDGAACESANLYGYGDLPGWLASVAKNGTVRLKMEYYKRKTLCEKALSIVEKRLAAAQN